MTDAAPTRIGIVGCGYVADFYLKTLTNHPRLQLAGVYDREPDRLARFAAHHAAHAYHSLEELLADRRTGIVVNLTNPRDHYQVSRACLEAGKHVYTEKPLATDWAEAVALADLAEGRGLQLSSAPCNVLGESAQTAWKALRDGAVGTPRLAYAEMDDGMVHLQAYREWVSESGCPWPYEDEFEVGCTLEHAGYYVTWLVAFFGPAVAVTSFAACLIPGKVEGPPLDPPDAPDFSVACLEFASGLVARLTCSIVAPHDHSLRIVGDEGVLSVDDCWDYGSAVHLRGRSRLARKAEKAHLAGPPLRLGSRRLPLLRRPSFRYRARGANRMDFCRGVAELAEAVAGGRPSRLSSRFSLHINEIVLAIHDPARMGSPRRILTSAGPMEPMPWAAPSPRRVLGGTGAQREVAL